MKHDDCGNNADETPELRTLRSLLAWRSETDSVRRFLNNTITASGAIAALENDPVAADRITASIASIGISHKLSHARRSAVQALGNVAMMRSDLAPSIMCLEFNRALGDKDEHVSADAAYYVGAIGLGNPALQPDAINLLTRIIKESTHKNTRLNAAASIREISRADLPPRQPQI